MRPNVSHLAFFAFFFILLITVTSSHVDAVGLSPKVFFQPGACIRVDGYNFLDPLNSFGNPLSSCVMGYDKRTLSTESTNSCLSSLVTAYLKEEDRSKALAGSICDKAVNDFWPFNYKIEESGKWDPDVGVCANTCSNGVPTKAVSCDSSAKPRAVCSRDVCGASAVDIECDGVVPDTNLVNGVCTKNCKFEPLSPFVFSVKPGASSVSVNQGGETTIRYTVRSESGSAQSVSMSCDNIPAGSGITCSFTPASCTPNVNNECGGDLKIKTTSLTSVKDYPIRIVGTSGSASAYATFQLSVKPKSAYDSLPFRFAIWAYPSDGGVVKPGTVLKSTVSVYRTQGTAEPVYMTCSPNFGATCKLNGQTTRVECPLTADGKCSVSMEVSGSIPQSYAIAVSAKGTKTIDAIATTSYKFTVAEEPTTPTTGDTGTVGDGGGPVSSCMDCTGGRCVPCGQGPYRYTMTLVPDQVSVAPGNTAPFSVNIERGSSTVNGDRSCTVSVGSYWAGDPPGPSTTTVSFSQTSCTVSPSSPTCSIPGTVRAESTALSGVYSDFVIRTVCNVPGTKDKTERLGVTVSSFDLDAKIIPASGTIEKGSSTSAVVNLVKTSRSGIQQPATLSCAGLPNGVSCVFSKLSAVLDDTFSGNFNRDRLPPTDEFGWITNAVQTVAGITDNGRGGRYDYSMNLYQAPHTSASVTKTVIVPPLEGRRLFLSLDYKLQNSFGPCKSSYRFCSSCKTCSYTEDNPSPASATITVRSPSSGSSHTVFAGPSTPVSSGQRCSDGRWGRSCSESFRLVDSSGAEIGSVRKETEWTYYFNQCRRSGCPETTYSGGYSTPWKTYSREITSLVSSTATTPLTITLENRRWGTRYDEYFTNSHTSSFDNIKIYAEPGFPGCTPTYSRNPATGAYGWWCEVPVTISSQPDSATGTFNIQVSGHDSANWFEQYRYGNIYYDWVTGKNQNYFDLSDAANYQLTVQTNCDPAKQKTTVSMPYSIVPDQEVPVTVEFTNCEYKAGMPVKLDLQILPDNFLWDVNSGCSIGGVGLGPPGGSAINVWPEGTISDDGRFKITATCKVPSVIEGGAHILRATPTIYPV